MSVCYSFEFSFFAFDLRMAKIFPIDVIPVTLLFLMFNCPIVLTLTSIPLTDILKINPSKTVKLNSTSGMFNELFLVQKNGQVFLLQ